MPIRTKPYRLTRGELGMLAAAEYVRVFWWFVLVTPLFGLLALLFGTGVVKAIGMFAIVWPFSIPARAMLLSTKSSRLFTRGCTMVADMEGVTFYGVHSEPRPLRFQIPASTIRDVVQRGPFLLVRTLRFGFAPVRLDAFENPADAEALLKLGRFA